MKKMLKDMLILVRNQKIFLNPKGEICNRLPAGTKVRIVQRKEGWMKVSWRNEKKQGWIQTE